MTRTSSRFDFLPLLTLKVSGDSSAAPSAGSDVLVQRIDALAKALSCPKRWGAMTTHSRDLRFPGLLATLLRDGGLFLDAHGVDRAIQAVVEQWGRDQIELERLRLELQTKRSSDRGAIAITWNEIATHAGGALATYAVAKCLLALGFHVDMESR